MVYANSLGAEAMVLTDIIATDLPADRHLQHRHRPAARGDPRRCSSASSAATAARIRARRTRRRRRCERLVRAQGINGFYNSLEARACAAAMRKVEPFSRAVAGYAAWVTGVRREQSADRARRRAPRNGTRSTGCTRSARCWTGARRKSGTTSARASCRYNALHDRSYPSIGCAPCTRAVEPGENHRAGRWWWEQPESRECGLHPRDVLPAQRLTAA